MTLACVKLTQNWSADGVNSYTFFKTQLYITYLKKCPQRLHLLAFHLL